MDTNKNYKSIQEGRDWYFVEYFPAISKNYAGLTLTIMNEKVDKVNIVQAMDKELKIWLARYPVPLCVTAWDISDNQYSFDELNKSKCLIGFFDDKGKIYLSWKANAKKPPDATLEKEYLDTVYSNVEAVTSVEHAAKRKIKNKQIERGVSIFLILAFLSYIWTLLFEVVLQNNKLFAFLTSLYIIYKACQKIFEYMGVWPFKSKRKREKEDEDRLKDQFYYFYKQNPEGFEKLKLESLDKMTKEKNIKTAKDLKMK